APKAKARSAAIRHSSQPHAPPQNQAPKAPCQAAAPWRTPHGRAATPPPTTTTGPSAGSRRSPQAASPPPTADGTLPTAPSSRRPRSPSPPQASNAAAGTHRSVDQRPDDGGCSAPQPAP